MLLLIGNWTYTHTIRRPEINDESPEVRTQIGVREYEASTRVLACVFSRCVIVINDVVKVEAVIYLAEYGAGLSDILGWNY